MASRKKKMEWVVGVDEAGRGALAGPVAVGAVCVPKGFHMSALGDIRDSKQLSPRARERIYEKMLVLRRDGVLDFSVALSGVLTINEKGIVRAVSVGISRSLYRLRLEPERTHVLLDGLLFAPPRFKSQKTIIRGDETEKAIALASILAKVYRDRHMVRLAKKYSAYGFHIHKGYGTTVHCQAVKKYGPCEVHRTLFIRNLA